MTFVFPETVAPSAGAEIETVGATVSGGTVKTAGADAAPGEPVESFATTVYEYVVGFRKLVAYADTSKKVVVTLEPYGEPLRCTL